MLTEAALVVPADAFMAVDVVDAGDRIPAEHLAAVEAVHLLKERHSLVRAIGQPEWCGRSAVRKRDQDADRHNASGDETA